MKLTIITLLLVMGFIGFCKYETSNDNSHTINLLRNAATAQTSTTGIGQETTGCTWDNTNWDACTLSQ